jgi:peroxiredoxin
LLLAIPLSVLAAGDLLDAIPETPKAPGFDLQTPDGARVALADLRGAVVVVNFWATWCPPCLAEMPAMERAWQGLRDKGVRFVAINVDEDGDTVSAFAERVGVSFPLLLDPGGKVTQNWPLRGLPTTFVVDTEGHSRLIALGERKWDAQPVMQQILSLTDSFAPGEATAEGSGPEMTGAKAEPTDGPTTEPTTEPAVESAEPVAGIASEEPIH